MAANKLVINGDKTHLVVMGSTAHTAKRQEVRLQAGDHTILPSSSEELLGGDHLSRSEVEAAFA